MRAKGTGRVERVCEWCGAPFTTYKCRVDRGYGRFCSRKCSNGPRTIPETADETAARFWVKVAKRGPDECWPWTAALGGAGYGKFSEGKRLVNASNAAWRLVNGPLPPGLQVNHHCDNPACCNPAHLYAGTPQENMRDRSARGRFRGGPPRGARNPSAYLTERDVPIIRVLLEAGMSVSAVARYFRVARMTITAIRDGKTWGHVT